MIKYGIHGITAKQKIIEYMEIISEWSKTCSFKVLVLAKNKIEIIELFNDLLLPT